MNRFCQVALSIILLSTCTAVHPLAAFASDGQVTVKELVIKGASDLSRSQIEDAKASVVGQRGTAESLMDRARQSLNASLESQCYLRPDIELSMLSRPDTSPDAVMYATVQDGVRYQLRKFNIQWARAASLNEIAQLLPLDAMRRGDCRGLDDVPSTVQDFYRNRGYRNVKVNPLIQPDKATRQFDLTLYIDEGSR